jgi:hypothetical protein
MKKKILRKGMKVRSVYTPEHVFVIDRVKDLGKIYHEKGSRRWWAGKELQGVTKPFVKLSAKRLAEAKNSRSEAFAFQINGITSKSKREYRRTCLNCGTEFTASRPEAKFCKTRGASCRAEYWKRRNLPPEIPKGRLRSEPELEESLADA